MNCRRVYDIDYYVIDEIVKCQEIEYKKINLYWCDHIHWRIRD